jgi:homoserine O-acetyltransferase/O-succinyltransferase
MIENRYYTQAVQGPYEQFDLGAVELEEGGVLPSCRLAYTTLGTLNERRDNVVLFPTWYAGTHLVPAKAYVGAGHALDPRRHFIVTVNQIGNGVSTSPHNTAEPLDMEHFPRVRIGDDVRAQERLLRERFGVAQVALVVGASMGAQQALEWAVRFPDRVERVAAIAGTARTPPQCALFAAALADALTSDPGFDEGRYGASLDVRAGLKRHARLWSLMGFSSDFWNEEGWRRLGFSSMERFLTGFMEVYFAQMDPNALLSMAWKWQQADVGRLASGDLDAALSTVTARTFVMPIDRDLCFTVADARADHERIPGSELRVLDSASGHLAIFGFDGAFVAQVDRHLAELLDSA